jgi:3-dehydrotetronate 4-kinase
MKLGCIADDFTGGTDLANNLARAGMRVVQAIGTPSTPAPRDVDAVVVGLKSRTAPPQDAIEESLKALQWLREQGAEQIYFKYCSTFDSTPKGNIGPVTEALMDALGTRFTVATPAFPDNGRTVFKGHLFVGDKLLSESGMQNHPLTPMTDSNLVRVLQTQSRVKVGLLDHRITAQEPHTIRAQMHALEATGARIAIVDAISNDDLFRIGTALARMPLVTGGSGLAIGLPANWGLSASGTATQLPPARGRRAILSGSCSSTTLRQVETFVGQGGHAMAIDPLRLDSADGVVTEAISWAKRHMPAGPVLIYSTAAPEAVKATQSRLGAASAGELMERVLARIARDLVVGGVAQLVIAGGETSGAVVQRLGISQLSIGPQIDPGVPWCHAQSELSENGLHVALKSGNFGSEDFFTKAFEQLNVQSQAWT